MLINKTHIVTFFALVFYIPFSWGKEPNKCTAKPESFALCQSLAAAGDDDASLTLGFLYETGLGVDKNINTAEQIYQKLADKNNKEAVNMLAGIKNGQGDREEAIRLYNRAIELGSFSALNNLGLLYKHQGEFSKAKELYEKAIKEGNLTISMIGLGDLYRDGNGVNQNITAAEELYKQALNLDDDLAITRLARLYDKQNNYEEAIKLYNIAIAKNDATAMNAMGLLYQHGWGVDRDTKKAVELFRQSSENKGIGGLINLGLMYENGTGVPQSYEKAIELYEKADQLGFTEAQLRIDFLKKNFIKK